MHWNKQTSTFLVRKYISFIHIRKARYMNKRIFVIFSIFSLQFNAVKIFPAARIDQPTIMATTSCLACKYSQDLLIGAIKENNVAQVYNILEHGALPKMCQFHYPSPLHIAIASGNLQIVQLLIIYSPNVIKDRSIKVSHLLAALNSNTSIVSEDTQLRIIKYLVALAPHTIEAPFAREMLLVIACGLNFPKIVRYCIDLGVDVNCKIPDYGYTALHHAVWENNKEIVELLLNAGALDIKGFDGFTPYEHALTHEFTEIIQLFNLRNNNHYMHQIS